MNVHASSSGQPSDVDLVQGARAGDQVSLGLLLSRHRAAMQSVALHLLGHGADVEDAVQDSMLTAMSKISDLRNPAAAGAWLRAITRNCCLVRLRARREVPLPEDLPIVSRELTPEAVIEQHALRDWVWHAIEELSPSLRLTVMLRYFSDVSSYEQIAAVCEVPIGTVRSRLSQARAKLTTALETTADQAHADAGRLVAARHAEGLELMKAAERGHFASALGDRWVTDPVFITGTGRRGGRDSMINILNRELEVGIRFQLERSAASQDLTVWDMTITNPPGDPEHCPPGVTWLVNLHGGRADRLRLFHAKRQRLGADD
ncbi:MAG: RNA polymerase sigma factor [Trebonia sp.]